MRLEAPERELAMTCHRLACRLAGPYRRAMPRHADDFESEAMLALSLAAGRFRESEGFRFTTYAHKCISVALANLARQLRRGATGFAAAMGPLPEFGDPIDPAPGPDDDPDGDPFAAILDTARLDARERRIVEEYYRDGRTLEAIGDDLGIGKERVRQLKHRALIKLRESAA